MPRFLPAVGVTSIVAVFAARWAVARIIEAIIGGSCPTHAEIEDYIVLVAGWDIE